MSSIPGPTRHDATTGVLPARTPGPLGINDAADPNCASQIGDTPGPLGINDHAAQPANTEAYRLVQVNELEAAEKRIQAQIKSVEQQLQSLDRKHVPDSHPWLTFKTVNSIQELKSLHPSLRSALRQDIVEFRDNLRRLKSEVQMARQQRTLDKVKARQNLAMQHFHDVEQKMADLLRKWKATGKQPEAELEHLLGVAEKVMEEQISVLNGNPSQENMSAVLKSMKTLALFGRDSDKGWSALSMASGRRVNMSISKLRDNPTKANVVEVLNRVKEACLLGNDAVVEQGMLAARDGAVKIREAAERQFRSMPTVSNFQALFKAQHDQALLGTDIAPDHPQGLRDAPRGTTHTIKPGESLSQLSARYFGSTGYWDVIIWRNVGIIRDPNVLPVGTTLIIA